MKPILFPISNNTLLKYKLKQKKNNYGDMKYTKSDDLK